MQDFILKLKDLDLTRIADVGGKNASLGEMIKHLTAANVQVPPGFATTADAYYSFLAQDGLDQRIEDLLSQLDINNLSQLAKTGSQIREWIMAGNFSKEFITAITDAYQELQNENQQSSFAVRSSATAEDLPDASFAGQQETYLNVQGLDNILLAIKKVFASLFNDRAITYRAHHGYDHHKIALSAGIQRMVRSDLAASGVAFSIDTESGFEDVIFITSSYGLGEPIVQGAVNPDEFYVYKPNLERKQSAIIRRQTGSKAIKMIYADAASDTQHTVTTVPVEENLQQQFSINDEEITFLAQQILLIEKHYGRPMDVEWAKDGIDGKIYIVQARPETVKSQANKHVSERFQLSNRSRVIAEGRSVGQRIGKGNARLLSNLSEMHLMQKGDVLVTDMTDPDWEPIMKRASAIVTNRGGRTCHAAIIARELGIPAVVGCGDATQKIKDGAAITVSCAEGETGFIYEGLLDFEVQQENLSTLPNLPCKIMLNVGNPEHAFSFRTLPNEGIGLARLEFMISQTIGIHPSALLNFASLPADLQKTIHAKAACYANPIEFYVEKLCEGISTLAAAFFPKKVIVRLSDFKSNEYAHLIGGSEYEPHEENPMIGFRGASRYISPSFRDCFALECRALLKARNELGFTNVEIMVPFVRTLSEAKQVINILAENGLVRGENGLRIIMMCEVPSNALLAAEFLNYFDGFSIGSNDLTQLTLGIDRDSGLIADQFDERDPAVRVLLQQAISTCKKNNKYVGICGQGPSDHPDFAQWLIEQGIDSISLNPDSVLKTILLLKEPAV
jgi:pyruvate,water dikinase